jgi:hypothetical protein
MPSRGSAMSLVSGFGARHGSQGPAEQSVSSCSHDRPRLGERIGVAKGVEAQRASGFVKIIETIGSLAPPVFRPTEPRNFKHTGFVADPG